MPVDIAPLAAAAGLGLLISGLTWRFRSHRRSRALVRQAIASPDPHTRQAALFIAAERDLQRYADLLIERIREETDENILDALAEVILRNQWEPGDDREVLELRLWAQSRLHMPTRAADGGPRGSSDVEAADTTTPTAPAEAASAEPDMMPAEAVGRGDQRELVEDFADLAPAVGESRTPTPAMSTTARYESGGARTSPAPGAGAGSGSGTGTGTGPPNGNGTSARRDRDALTMVRPRDDSGPGSPPRRATASRPASRLTRSLPAPVVTGAGGPAGIAVIRALHTAGHRVIAADADALAAGMRLASEAAVVPRADDPTFVEALCNLGEETGAAMLVPTLAEELIALVEGSAHLASAGLAAWLPAPSAVDACLDKWRFAQLTRAAGIPAPITNLGSADGVPGAWVVKPRFGRGSRGVQLVDRADDLAWALQHVTEPIVQTRLTGREFTVDVLVDRDGDLAGAVPRWRLETKAGISTKGRTFENADLVRNVGRLLRAVGLTGPANVQGFVAADGSASFVEVNPRFSGGLPLSLAAGADLVGEYVRGVLGQPIRRERLLFRPGVTMIRHFEEVFE